MKEPVDNSKFVRHTEYPGRDAIFNAIVRRYGKKGNIWTKSDEFIWGGALYYVWDYFFALMFIYLVYWLATATYDRFGLFKAMMVVTAMTLLRINALVRKLTLNNQLMKKMVENQEKLG